MPGNISQLRGVDIVFICLLKPADLSNARVSDTTQTKGLIVKHKKWQVQLQISARSRSPTAST